ncbi:MAG: TonB-dependent receptor, partial [Acidobacteriota bacterium]|nr:TonB-dependent receptor [Acidobacteriota bacterium]
FDENNPISDSYTDKLVGRVRFTHPDERFFIEYGLTHNGEQDDLANTSNPIGPTYPSFTVHDLLAGVKLYERRGISHTLGIAVQNLTDELYAQFTNAGFFRPEPGRSARLEWRLGF